jgi:acid stress chaperone HdeA
MNGKGKPEDAVIDVDRTNRLVPVLVEDCTKEPSASYRIKMKQEFKKIF